MSLNRVLKYLNYLVAIALLAVLGAGYWFAYRVLPRTTGEIAAPLGGRARVVRDAHGTPHIFAASAEDAVFVQGYVTAQDRLWQMDALRRFAAGTLAEVVGSRALETDKETRQLRTRRIVEEQYKHLEPRVRALLRSVCSRCERVHRIASRSPAPRVHAAQLRSAAVDDSRQHARRNADVSRHDDDLAR